MKKETITLEQVTEPVHFKEALELLQIKPKSLSEALYLTQMQIIQVGTDGDNTHFKSKYATYEKLVAYVKPILNNNGLWFMQKSHLPPDGRNGVVVETIFYGFNESMSAGQLFMQAQASTPQGYGSALTYAKRYALATALSVPHGKDDDAHSSTIETLQTQIASEAPEAVPEGKFTLFSGETAIASYDNPDDFLQGCRKYLSKPKEMECQAIFQQSETFITMAIASAQGDTKKGLQKLLECYE